ncbi:MAG: MBL fold metallo-hydrolase [Thermoanaerobaculia bacterium]|nr:MBL fold metallo-hydrolase [Thermoanaerobaculia bacterium]
MILQRFTVGPFAENAYLVGDAPRIAIVDPGGESDRIGEFIEEKGWKPERILLTHGHLDHIAHVAPLAERYGIGCWIHRDDRGLLEAQQFPELVEAVDARPCPDPEGFLEDGEIHETAGLRLRVLHTPGHTPGGVCFFHEESRSALVGDTIFHRGIGRTDLPGGDMATLADSIRNRLFVQEGEWELWPGHGPATRLSDERRENPFFGSAARFTRV